MPAQLQAKIAWVILPDDLSRSLPAMALPLTQIFASEERVYDDAGNVIETHEHKGDFKEW